MSEELRLLVAARQWLAVLIDQIDIDPEETVMEVNVVSPGEHKRVVAQVKLADTLREIDKIVILPAND